jgi:hypothetical protein
MHEWKCVNTSSANGHVSINLNRENHTPPEENVKASDTIKPHH